MSKSGIRTFKLLEDNVANLLLEYIWLDGYQTSNLRSKVKVFDFGEDREITAADCPDWNFDGSSTQQAPGHASECILKPGRTYRWKENHYLVLCEVLNTDGTPHESNHRAGLHSTRVPEGRLS